MSECPNVRWDDDGRPHWRHDCVAGSTEVQLPLSPDRWQVVDGHSITPSIGCTACGTHGWWVKGQWWGKARPGRELAERRADTAFRDRLRHRIAADRSLLNRLADGDGDGDGEAGR